MTPWQAHVAKWKDCELCGLCRQRDRIVLARGTIPCDVLLVGEAPGESENVIGQPFCGPAGKLLDKIVERAITWQEIGTQTICPTVAFTNLVCCFPREAKERGDNEPEVAEIRACAPRLREFVDLCSPKLVVAVGKLADAHLNAALPGTTFYAGGKVGGHFSIQRWTSVTHPAAILRMPVVQQDAAIHRSVVILSNAVEQLML